MRLFFNALKSTNLLPPNLSHADRSREQPTNTEPKWVCKTEQPANFLKSGGRVSAEEDVFKSALRALR